jgi:sugar/nucleoside kinase (ribokinase family)/serine/threonine protein kinase
MTSLWQQLSRRVGALTGLATTTGIGALLDRWFLGFVQWVVPLLTCSRLIAAEPSSPSAAAMMANTEVDNETPERPYFTLAEALPSDTSGSSPSPQRSTRALSISRRPSFKKERPRAPSRLSSRSSVRSVAEMQRMNSGSSAATECSVPDEDIDVKIEDIEVVVFGSINMDIKARAMGEWPKNDSSDFGALSHQPGGKGMNEAVAIARLGVKTALVGRVGNDEHGCFLKQELQRNMVHSASVRGGATEEGAAAAARAATRGLEWEMVDVEGEGALLEHPKLAEALGERFDSSTEEHVQITQQEFDEWNLGGMDGGGGGGGGGGGCGGLASNCFVRVACRDGKERRFVPVEKEIYTGTAVQIVGDRVQGKGTVKYTVTCPEANYEVGLVELQHARAIFAAGASVRLRHAAAQKPSGAVPGTPNAGPHPSMGPLLLLQLELRAEVMLKAIEAANEHGVTIAFRAAPLRMGSESLDTALRILGSRSIDILFLDGHDAPNLLSWVAGRELVTLADAEMAADEILSKWAELSAVVIICPIAHVFRERRGHSWLGNGRWRGGAGAGSGHRAQTGAVFGATKKVGWDPTAVVAGNPRAADPAVVATRPQRILIQQTSFDRALMSSLARPASSPITEGGGEEGEDDEEGEEGAGAGGMLAERDELLVVPRSKHMVKDNIGAADAFVGGFIAAAVRGHSNIRCLLWAHAAAVISCSKEGAQKSLPKSPTEIEELLAYECPAWRDHSAWRDHPRSRWRSLLRGAQAEPSIPASPAALPGGVGDSVDGGMRRPVGRGDSWKDDPRAARAERSHSQLHWDVMHADLDKIWKLLPSTADLDKMDMTKLVELRAELQAILEWRDYFGLTPCQRAYQCYLLRSSDWQFRVTLVELLVAQLLLHPQLLLRGTVRHPELAPDAAPVMATFEKHEANCFSDLPTLQRLLPKWTEADEKAVRAAAAEHDQHEPLLLEAKAKAVAKAERAEKAKGAKAKESSLPLWYYDVETDQPLLSEGVARTLAAQVTLAMLAPEQERRLEEEAEASNRLIARCVCMVLHSEDKPMSDALLAARAKNGASLLVAACQAGITAIVRTLFDKGLIQESDVEEQRVILTVKSVAPEGEGESIMPRRDQSFRKSSRRSSSGHENFGSTAEPLPLSRSVSSLHASSFEDLPSASPDDELLLNALEAAIFAGPSEVIAFECSLRATDCLCAPECRATDCLGWPLIALFAGPSQHHHEVCLLILKHTRLEVPGPESRLAQILLRQGRDKSEWLNEMRRLQDDVRRAPGALSTGTRFKDRYSVTTYVTNAKRVAIANDLVKLKSVAVKVTESAMGELEVKTLEDLNKKSPSTAPHLLDHFICNEPPHQGKRVLVLEKGESISKVRKNDEVVQRADAWQLLQCVNALHESCMKVHTDIKLQHFLRIADQIRLIDYDSVVEENTEHSMPNYTPEYVSPEVAYARQNNKPVMMTRAVDVWACGLVLFELFTGGQSLFDSSGDSVEMLGGVRDTEWETQAKIVDGIVKQRLDASQLSESAREILLSMLHADPYERVLLRDLLQASATADGSRVRPSATECDRVRLSIPTIAPHNACATCRNPSFGLRSRRARCRLSHCSASTAHPCTPYATVRAIRIRRRRYGCSSSISIRRCARLCLQSTIRSVMCARRRA